MGGRNVQDSVCGGFLFCCTPRSHVSLDRDGIPCNTNTHNRYPAFPPVSSPLLSLLLTFPLPSPFPLLPISPPPPPPLSPSHTHYVHVRRWYTSMLGKKTTLKTICRELKQHKVHNYVRTVTLSPLVLTCDQIPIVTTSRFIQGKTHRWAVAWSFNETQEHKVRSPVNISISLGMPFSAIFPGMYVHISHDASLNAIYLLRCCGELIYNGTYTYQCEQLVL